MRLSRRVFLFGGVSALVARPSLPLPPLPAPAAVSAREVYMVGPHRQVFASFTGFADIRPRMMDYANAYVSDFGPMFRAQADGLMTELLDVIGGGHDAS